MDLFNISQDAWQQLLLLNGRICVVLACCLVLIQWQKSTAATRHFLAGSGLIAAAALPWLYPLLPAIDIIVEVHQQAASSAAAKSVSSDNAALPLALNSSINGLQILLLAYMVSAVFLLSRVLLSNLKVFALSRLCKDVIASHWQQSLVSRQQSYGIRRKVVIKHSSLVRSPATYGVLQPVILIPSDALQWSEQLINSTLLHELAHIKRSDWLTLQLARVVCAVYWFNPLVWLTYNKLNHYAESASDDLAINAGIDRANYANDLVMVASQLQHCQRKPRAVLTMATSAKCSELKQRVLDIVSPDVRHLPMSGWQKMACFVLVGLLILPLASLRTNYIERVIEIPVVQPQRIFPVQLTETPSTKQEQEMPAITAEPMTDKSIIMVDPAPTPLPKIPQSKPAAVQVKKQPVATVAAVEPTPSTTTTDPIEQTPVVQSQVIPSQELTISEPQINAPEIVIDNEVPAIAVDVVEEHAKLNMVIPRYPNRAQNRGIEGEVKVEYSLDKFGKVTEAKVVSAQPPRLFDRQVLKAIKRSTYHPRRVNGEAVAASGLIEKYVFVLES